MDQNTADRLDLLTRLLDRANQRIEDLENKIFSLEYILLEKIDDAVKDLREDIRLGRSE